MDSLLGFVGGVFSAVVCWALDRRLNRGPKLASQKQIALYEVRRFQWDMAEDFPSVLKMKNDLTFDQARELLNSQEDLERDMEEELQAAQDAAYDRMHRDKNV